MTIPAGANTLALLGGTPSSHFHDFPRDEVNVPLEAASKVAENIQSGKWSMFTSDEVISFERELAEFVGARHAVLVNSCTSAIHATLSACGVKSDSIVAAPAFTYVGTCLPAIALGAKLALVDINPETQSMNSDSLRNVFRKYPISAVVHAHLFGKSWEADDIAGIARANRAHYVSDAAQLLGVKQQTTNLGSIGPCCFSFGDSKLLRLGEGGAVVTNDDELAEAVRRFRHEGEAWLRLGKSRIEGFKPTPRDVLSNLATVSLGLNYRPVAAIAALGRVMLRDLPNFLARTRSNASALTAGLSDLCGVTLPPDAHRSWWTFPVIFNPQLFDRDVTLACLLAEGIPVGVHFPRVMSEHPLISQYVVNATERFPGADYFAHNHLVLPIYPALNQEHMKLIVAAIRKVLGSIAGNYHRLRELSSDFLNTREIDSLSSGLFLFLRENAK